MHRCTHCQTVLLLVMHMLRQQAHAYTTAASCAATRHLSPNSHMMPFYVLLLLNWCMLLRLQVSFAWKAGKTCTDGVQLQSDFYTACDEVPVQSSAGTAIIALAVLMAAYASVYIGFIWIYRKHYVVKYSQVGCCVLAFTVLIGDCSVVKGTRALTHTPFGLHLLQWLLRLEC